MLRKELNPVLMTALVIGATVGSGICPSRFFG